MFTDVVHLKLDKPAVQSEEGVPLTSLGEPRKQSDVDNLVSLSQVAELVSISTKAKIIYSSSELKKEKFTNVRNLTATNSSILSTHIKWPFTRFVGTHFIRRFSSVVRLIGP